MKYADAWDELRIFVEAYTKAMLEIDDESGYGASQILEKMNELEEKYE